MAEHTEDLTGEVTNDAPPTGPGALQMINIELLADCTVQVGRADEPVATVLYTKGSVLELPAEQALLFIGVGRAQRSRKKHKVVERP